MLPASRLPKSNAPSGVDPGKFLQDVGYRNDLLIGDVCSIDNRYGGAGVFDILLDTCGGDNDFAIVSGQRWRGMAIGGRRQKRG